MELEKKKEKDALGRTREGKREVKRWPKECAHGEQEDSDLKPQHFETTADEERICPHAVKEISIRSDANLWAGKNHNVNHG